ncbi:MAG: 3-hydroxyacyl-CoA dehydrogenase [Anaerolineae bacterium UTCFX2]|nr:enoyl-CoA hydratase/isomerase family protein [Anaerolineae bacterium]MCZ7551611.1 3-hydroxyacyl-CoA dehydrogenase/enoyl-CoA hydratase family protein [Anaerolineales bacterium]OQY88137.1 MAG: 3-hydroxyacyl-CoA dehydrogenase [Anaerolineae bacterium UTCFX2]
MQYNIYHVVVIGAGTMGAGIAAHLANAGVRVTLLDVIPKELTPDEAKKGLSLADPVVRNRIVREGLDRALKSRPASFFTPERAAWVKIGNLEDDFEAVREADWVIEVVVENLEIKRRLMERVDAVRKPDAIVSTNTSGIPVSSIAEGRSQSFKQHFLGTHFFNPPRYLKLLEVIPTKDTLVDVVDSINRFCELRLGKGIVPAKDTPNFIANRLAFGSAAFALDYILKNGYTVDEVDAITGPAIGNPKTATFRLIDLVGIDVWDHVGRNLMPAIPYDEHALRYLASEPVQHLIDTLVGRGSLGGKTKEGFYKEVRTEGGKEFRTLNLSTLEYEPAQKVRIDSLGKVKDKEKLAERLQILLEAEDRAGQLVRALTYQSLAYASERVPEIADTPKPIDDAMRWGFGREAGPFETWDMLGVAEAAQAMRAAGFPAAPWVDEMLSVGCASFYQYQDGTKVGVFNPSLGAYETIPRMPGRVALAELKAAGRIIKKNPGANLYDLGDGVAGLEFKTKMGTLDTDIFEMIQYALDMIEGDYEGLVIGHEGDNFSAGANLFLVVMSAQSGQWEQLEALVKSMQDILMRVRYFPKPVVVAPAGMALGGGAEVTMSASRVVAAAELYAGLVEIGAGVIPAGGGTKEIMRRVINPAMRTKNLEPLALLQRAFEQIGLAKVATSAEEARQMGILGPADRVVMNRDALLSEAKKEVLYLRSTGYQPPLPEKIYAAGRDALAAMQVGIYMMKEGGYITEYEAVIAGKLAGVLTGGDLSSPAWVDEQYILDLEREAFLWLCGQEKTQQRMWNLLQTGKPLRN